MGLCKYCWGRCLIFEKKHKECSILHDVNKNKFEKWYILDFWRWGYDEIKRKGNKFSKKILYHTKIAR